MKRNDNIHDNLLDSYLNAKHYVLSQGFESEIEWQKSLCIDNITETDFLREAAWVILCSGFREAYVRKIFDKFSLCFCDWENARIITERADICKQTALTLFSNDKKIEAIIQICNTVSTQGFLSIKEEVEKNPIEVLQRLPYIGPITSFHLAKNLGCPVAKPDRHLVRIANKYGYCDVQEFCKTISSLTGDLLTVVDIVFWRFAELHTSKQLQLFKT
jgi:hypothetical protein